MASQIRPNRLEVSDRFPMLGFTIQVDDPTSRGEIALFSNLTLARSEGKSRRTRNNFWSSKAAGPIVITRGEAVYIVPPQVLGRFIGQEKLYYALATYRDGNGAKPEISFLPTEGSPYINLRQFTGRTLRHLRMLPSRQGAGYGVYGGGDLEWGGDVSLPGLQPIATPGDEKLTSSSTPAAPVSSPGPVQSAALDYPEYNDGFGAWPEPAKMPLSPRLAAECFSLNWDEVQLIPQPTNTSCWATSAAMIKRTQSRPPSAV